MLWMIFSWSHLGLNQGPPDYESGATNQLSYRTPSILEANDYSRISSAKVLLFFEMTKKIREKRKKKHFWLQIYKKNGIFAHYLRTLYTYLRIKL